MQISSRLTIAVHILAVIDFLGEDAKVTSSVLAGSIGVNPVIVRTVMGQLKEAGIIESSQGKSGITLAKDLRDVTFYDLYKAVDAVNDDGMFHFHENPNPECPVGRNIHMAMDDRLLRIQKAMEDEMRNITVAEVTTDIRKANGMDA
ncbi:MAG: Rrf2 family transcriptional regulator [Ruminococcaceae bacterium]|nr:Rrf2 family transcriptional regulator [Oscillospiraceae bacterium]